MSLAVILMVPGYFSQEPNEARVMVFFGKYEGTFKVMFDIDAETMDAIEKWAADEFRSINGQLQWIIAEALRKSGRMKKKRTNQTKEEEE